MKDDNLLIMPPAPKATSKVTTEMGLVNQVQAWLKLLPLCWFFKVPGGPYLRGIPDIIGCYNGKFFALELKEPGRLKRGDLVPKNDSERQQSITIRAIKKAGGIAGFYDQLDQVQQDLLAG
jgi:hypothetical protein